MAGSSLTFGNGTTGTDKRRPGFPGTHPQRNVSVRPREGDVLLAVRRLGSLKVRTTCWPKDGLKCNYYVAV